MSIFLLLQQLCNFLTLYICRVANKWEVGDCKENRHLISLNQLLNLRANVQTQLSNT